MSLFLFIEYQDGGCDYTIGCGVRVSKLMEADSASHAITKFVAMNEHDYRDENGKLCSNPWAKEYSPDDVELYEVVMEHGINLDAIRQRAQNEIDGVKLQETEAIERAEYERLREKFGE